MDTQGDKSMFQVKKRDGKLVEFDMSKITTALSKAFNAKQVNYTSDILNTLALKVTADFSKKIKDNVITVEDIQDSAEVVLIQSGLPTSRSVRLRHTRRGCSSALG